LNSTRTTQLYPLSLHDALPIFTDREVGRLLRQLRETGLLDKALLVATADHGFAWEVGVKDRRKVTPGNVDEIAPQPLFIKAPGQDRKSTRLNSSHEWISYAVFC